MSAEQQPEPAPEMKPAPNAEQPHTPKGPVFVAAILGGLLGAVFSLVLARSFPPPEKPRPEPQKSEPTDQVKSPIEQPKQPTGQRSEAHEIAASLVGKLKVENFDEFAKVPLIGFGDKGDQWRDEVKKTVHDSREYCKTAFGKPSGELELMREVAYGPSVTRLVFLEKFTQGGVVWALGLFRAPDGWALISLSVQPLEKAYPLLP